jgi:hypothetical protein
VNAKPGYIRNYQGHIDATASYRITQPGLTAPICAPFQQTFNQYSNPLYPQLIAAPGDYVQGIYLENGHVTLLQTPESKSGTVYWFGTTVDSPSRTLADVMAWKQGGNKQGVMLSSATPFDDGLCAEDNGSPIALARKAKGGTGPCKSAFKIPENLKDGSIYTVYWVWDFSKHFAEPADRVEWYTSCIDIKIQDRSKKLKRSAGDDEDNNDSWARSAKFRGRL